MGEIMKKFFKKIIHNHHFIPTIISILFLFVTSPLAWADSFAQLKGFWECQEEGLQSTLEFKSRQQLLYNGQVANYQLAPGVLQVQEEQGLANYFYKFEGTFLLILSSDGSITQCQKAKKSKQTKTQQKSSKSTSPRAQTPSHDQAWPPPYARPQGQIDEYNPSAQALLYKFAGRWDHYTGNTLTNLFLKPDGTYEEAYEAGYSGVMKNQGGYQTGSWGATGTQQARGHWKAAGGLRQGKLYLVDQNGRQGVISFQVHIKDGEIYSGEYFFNGKLYSVSYIYR
jgi:hypothetical protein